MGRVGVAGGHDGGALGECRKFGNAIQVRGVPQLFCLGFQRFDQVRMAVAKRVDRNAGTTVQQAAAIAGSNPTALAGFNGEWCAIVGR